MRSAALVAVLLLAGCSGSGFWSYERDTFTIPGANPNHPVSDSENFLRSRGAKLAEPQPLLTEAGDVWPGPPAPVPTLKDLQKQQMSEINGAGTTLTPLPSLPSLPGYEISQQQAAHPAPASAFRGDLAIIPGGRGSAGIGADRSLQQLGGPTGTGPIVVPNGNGTSTVINPNGSVSTIPTPK